MQRLRQRGRRERAVLIAFLIIGVGAFGAQSIVRHVGTVRRTARATAVHARANRVITRTPAAAERPTVENIPADAIGIGPAVPAKSAIVLDIATGRVLYAKHPDLPLEPASTTKILTALVTVDTANLNDVVKVPREATLVDGSKVPLKAGERFKLLDLLYGLLLNSGNDAAVAIADHVAGSVPKFARLMNEKARQVGAENSHFANPHGLPNPDHVTTAYDLAVIARAAISNPVLNQIVGTKSRQLMSLDGSSHPVQNHNKLLWRYEGADGVKNGWTAAAQHTLIASATRGGHRLLVTILGDPSYGWTDAAKLLNFGFTRVGVGAAETRQATRASDGPRG